MVTYTRNPRLGKNSRIIKKFKVILSHTKNSKLGCMKCFPVLIEGWLSLPVPTKQPQFTSVVAGSSLQFLWGLPMLLQRQQHQPDPLEMVLKL